MNRGEILPNNDGTLQISADLDLSSVKPEDWRSYDCVFQLCGVNKDIITRLDRAVIRTNEGQSALRSDEGQKHHLVYCNIIVHSKEQFMQFYVLKIEQFCQFISHLKSRLGHVSYLEIIM